jgi:hypothetical protein
VSRAWRKLPLLAVGVLLGAVSPSAASALSFQPQLGAPENLQFFGASPAQAPGEVWGTAEIGSVPATVDGTQISDSRLVVRRAQGTGWQVVPVTDEEGELLDFRGTPRATEDGGLAMLEETEQVSEQTIITRNPTGASFVPAPSPAAVLEKGESLSEGFAVVDEQAGSTGALILPQNISTSAPGVLHYDGAKWTREPICTEYEALAAEPCKGPPSNLRASGVTTAIAASSPQNAWLLASRPNEALMLFKRTEVAPGSFAWTQSDTPVGWAPEAQDAVTGLASGQLLTVTSRGVWVDADLHGAERASLSVFLEAEPDGASGRWSGKVLGRWCFPELAGCNGSLGEALPANYSSFAWAGGGGFGTRIIVGLSGGSLLRFQDAGDFQYVPGGGGGESTDAAFAKSGDGPEEGWIAGDGGGEHEPPGISVGGQLEHISATGEPPALGQSQSWPLPFRRPLLAIAPEPGTLPGDPSAQALAVGDQGEIARYLPGKGWTPEFLYNGSGAVQRPRLRAVAWPEPGRAYAVGDEGVMWLWRADTGLWEPDPAEPLGLHANLTAIAFSTQNPAVGYAVGKQGTLLAYDKTWTQQELPPGLEQADFTSVAFAGGQALATYRMAAPHPETECTATANKAVCEVGGLIVNNGSGWEIDASAQQLLGALPTPTASVLSKVAGLPDGGAVAAGPRLVIERDSASSPWRFSREPLPGAENISALAAIRAGSEVQALVSIDLAAESNPNESELLLRIDNLPPPGFGQPFALVGPDPLPFTGYLLRETSEGWQDLEQQAYPSNLAGNSQHSSTEDDLPDWPDPVLALDVDPSGSEGWAVGGRTTGLRLESNQIDVQSATALRLGPGSAPSQSAGAPIPTSPGQATFAVGGGAQCLGPCASLEDEGLGPALSLSHAVSTAAGIPGLRAFLYTGARVAGRRGLTPGSTWSLSSTEFVRELQGYGSDLSAAGPLPVRVAPSPSDLDSQGGLSTFTSVLGADAGAGSATGPGGIYEFQSGGAGGTVLVIVLDYSTSSLAPGELGWLQEQLEAAQRAGLPAIVMGNADIRATGSDHVAVQRVLLEHGASAYLFDSPNENRAGKIAAGSREVPVFGTGTLGYVPPPRRPQEFLGASGFLLVNVNVARRNPRTNVAPVTVTLTPNISQLALDATDGTLLRRSQVALFQALARRPLGGSAVIGGFTSGEIAPDPYVPIPETCNGPGCSQFIEPEYTFSSSNPEVGNFVKHEASSEDPRKVLQNAKGEPESDPHSPGVFCAFNSGTTTVSITTGGLTYSEPVTVQAGSVEQPCGTVRLKNPPAVATTARVAPSAPPPSAPAAGSPSPVALAPPPPPPPAPAPPAVPSAPRAPAPPPPFFAKPLSVAPLVALPLLPPPPLARPIPPSGTSPVTAPAAAPKEEEEDEEAVESARNSMALYNPEDPFLPPISMLALVVIAAGAGAAIRRSRRGRRTGRAPALARSRARR